MDSDDEFALPAPIGQQQHRGNGNGRVQQQPARPARNADLDLDNMDMEEQQLDAGAGQEQENQIQQLMRHWMDERNAPELLYFQDKLVDQVMHSLEAQTEAVDLLSASSSSSSANNDHERILLVQLEIERVKYLLRAYLRIRTYKIETFSQYLLKNPAAKAKMSDVEMGYAERYRKLVEKHLTQSVIANLPERLGRLDEEEMIIKPDLDVAVFARALRDCPEITLPDGAPLAMRKGDTHMLRYRSIRRLLKDGLVRLV